jgi:hypothetical protein
MAFEQCSAQQVFHVGQGLGRSGLAHAHHVGGALDRARIDQGDQQLQMRSRPRASRRLNRTAGAAVSDFILA